MKLLHFSRINSIVACISSNFSPSTPWKEATVVAVVLTKQNYPCAGGLCKPFTTVCLVRLLDKHILRMATASVPSIMHIWKNYPRFLTASNGLADAGVVPCHRQLKL